MSQFLRHVLKQNHESARTSIAKSIDKMEWEESPQENALPGPASLQQLAPQASRPQHQPNISQAAAPLNDFPQRPNPHPLPLTRPRPQPVPWKNLAEKLASGPPFIRPVTRAPFSNGQAYKHDTVPLSDTWYYLKQAEDLAIQRKMDQLRSQSTARRCNYPYTPTQSTGQSTIPNSRKRLIEAVDGYSQDECRASHDIQKEPQYHNQQQQQQQQQQQEAEYINTMPESPIDTSMMDVPPYESSLLKATPVNSGSAGDKLQRTPQQIPGTWPTTPASTHRIPIPPTEIFHRSEVDMDIIRDQVALMSGALAGYSQTSSQGMIVPLSDGDVLPPTSPEHAYELEQQLTYLQQILQIFYDIYFPTVKAMCLGINKVGDRAKQAYQKFVQAAVEVAGSAKRRAVVICGSITPEFVRRKLKGQQDIKNIRRPSSSERHHLKARRLGMGKRKQGTSSPEVTLDEYEDITPPRRPRDMRPSEIIQSYRHPTQLVQRKDGVVKGAKVQKKKMSNKSKLKTKTSTRVLAQLSTEDVNQLSLSRAPRRGELIKGAWPNAIPPSKAALRAFHESFRDLRNKKPAVGESEGVAEKSQIAKPSVPPRGYGGIYFPGPENQPPLPPLPAATVTPSTPPQTELPLPAEEPVDETEDHDPSKDGLPIPSQEYEGFLTGHPELRRETKEVHWLKSDSPMGRPISSVRAYDPLSRVTSFQPHGPANADAEARPAPTELTDQSAHRSPEAPYVKHLTATWEAKVDRAMALSDKSEVGTTPRGDPLTRKSLQTCYTNRKWLNDEVINAYLELIVDYARQNAGNSGRHDKPKYHAFTTFFYSNLRDKGYESVRRWATRAKVGGENLLGVEMILIPVHDHSHWTLIVIRPTARTIEHFDSLGSHSLTHIARVKGWLHAELGDRFVEEEWRVLPSISPQQNNGYDCGVFLLTTAKLVSFGKPLKYGATDIPEIRKRIVAELMNGGFFGDFDPKNEMVPARSML
ncbi:hypothetical protein AJ78_06470 [Emergomyces pasteurianus Ep9510]|uniref:Ubiquitin-like protease family profile domain-containing protein n=1 Tax=Emergomyces pasteurianus Ep9510 TaxID=1447872 RepID=A0A1J9P8S8_9EURO|nr:hypothetical protein AJ78_06470 [Emergomyces pasteurianus Ep9510]